MCLFGISYFTETAIGSAHRMNYKLGEVQDLKKKTIILT